MLKALLKKQFLELNKFYFQDKKTGKLRSKGKKTAYIVLFVLIFLLVAGIFAGFGSMLGATLLPAGLDELYFAIFGLMAVVLGVFGSVFNTYAGLYQAKDNELLLAMPIPPSKILFARMVGVYAMGLLFEALVLVPAIVVYWVIGTPTVLGVILPILLVFILAFLVLVLTCALGWVVALISSRLKNKSIITVIITLAFLALYYVVYFRLISSLENILLYADRLNQAMQTKVWFFWQFGEAACGKLVPFALFSVITAALFFLVYYVMSHSFLRLATTSRGSKKAIYVEREAKSVSLSSALRRKELKRLLSSPIYLLNTGLGIPILLIAAVLLFVKLNVIRDSLGAILSELAGLAPALPIFATALMIMAASMDGMTAPSISLEGKNIWILQSLPVRVWDIFRAKAAVQIELNAFPLILCTAALGCAVRADFVTVALMCVCAAIYEMFDADFGLFLNLLRPNLSWTSETVPVKQGMSVVIEIFGGWAIAILFAVPALLMKHFSAPLYLAVGCVVIAAADVLLRRWLKNRGAEIFSTL